MRYRGTHTIVQLTDTHLRLHGQMLYGSLDPWRRLERALEATAGFRPDAVLVTGDIADCGSDVYDAAAELFAWAGARMNAPVIVLPGNHDIPAAAQLPQPGQPALEGPWSARAFTSTRTAEGPGPGDAAYSIAGLRILTLDSDNPLQASGSLSPAQLKWLDLVLREPARDGTLLAMHHPPVDSLLPQLKGRGLAQPEDLRAALAGTDVRAIVAGHYHHAMSAQLGLVPVWIGPAVSYNQNLRAPAGSVQGKDTSWLSVLTFSNGAFSAVPVPLRLTNTTVFSVPARTATSRIPRTTTPAQPLLRASQGDSLAAPR